MDVFSKIAEQKIKEAMENGEFEDLAGRGKPISLEDESWIPEDLRMSYRVLKNAGCLPPELELRKEILSLRELLNSLDDDRERIRRIRELNFKLLKLNELRKRPFNLDSIREYEEKVTRKLLD